MLRCVDQDRSCGATHRFAWRPRRLTSVDHRGAVEALETPNFQRGESELRLELGVGISGVDYQPISVSNRRVRSSGFFTLLVRSGVRAGSINRLGVAVTSQCDTDDPGAVVAGA